MSDEEGGGTLSELLVPVRDRFRHILDEQRKIVAARRPPPGAGKRVQAFAREVKATTPILDEVLELMEELAQIGRRRR